MRAWAATAPACGQCGPPWRRVRRPPRPSRPARALASTRARLCPAAPTASCRCVTCDSREKRNSYRAVPFTVVLNKISVSRTRIYEVRIRHLVVGSAELWMDPEMWIMMSISFDDGDVLAQSLRSLLKVCYEYDLIWLLGRPYYFNFNNWHLLVL